MAHISKHKREETTGERSDSQRKMSICLVCLKGSKPKVSLFLDGPGLSKEDKESLRQKELKQMKAKYGLHVSLLLLHLGLGFKFLVFIW